MDNLTHSLTGLMLARTGLGRLTPRATLVVVLAANLPDSDVYTWFQGHPQYLDIHRGFTHSWALLPVMAAAAAAIGWCSLRFGKAKSTEGWSWWKAWLAAAIGVASHILLDWTNNYGVRFGLPFEGHWHRLDAMFIVDPWLWALLLFGVAGPFLSRLVSLEIGARKTGGAGTAWFVLVMMAAYIAGSIQLHEQALRVLETRVYNGQAPRRVAAFPVFGNPLRWRAVVEVEDGYWVSMIKVTEEVDPSEGRMFFHPSSESAKKAIEAVRGSEEFAAFARFNAMPLWRVVAAPQPSAEGSVKVELFDLRFGDPAAPGFVASAILTQRGGPEREELRFGPPRIH